MNARVVTLGVYAFAALGCERTPDAPLASPAPLVVERPDTLLARADSLYLAGDVPAARAIWLPALRSAESRGDSAVVANLLTSLGLAHRKVAEYLEARELLERSLALKQTLGQRSQLFRSLNALGLLAEDEGRLADATSYYERAAEAANATGDSLSAAKAAHNQGLIHRRIGSFDRARTGISALIDVARSVRDSVSLLRALSNLAMLNAEVGDALGAVAQLHEVRRLSQAAGDVELEDNALGQLAMAYDALGEPTAALAALDSALRLTREHGMRRQEAENLRLLGDLYLDAGDVRRALENYAAAQRITSQLGLTEESADALLSEAQAQFALERTDLAKRRAADALRIHRGGGFRFSELGDLVVLAELEQVSGNAAAANSHLRSASAIATTLDAQLAGADVALASARVADLAGDPRRVLLDLDRVREALALASYGSQADAHALRARAYARLDQLEAAATAGRQALAAIERVRGGYRSGPLRTSYTSAKSELYADQILVLLRLGRVAEAFEVADAARGRALVEHLLVAREGVRQGVSVPSLLAESERVLRRIDTLVARLRETERTREPRQDGAAGQGGVRDPEFHDRSAELAAARSEYESLLLRSAQHDANAAALLGNAPTTGQAVRANLRPDEALIEYFVMPRQLLIFVVTRDSVRHVMTPSSADELTSRVRLARELLGSRATSVMAQGVLEALHRLLLRPALQLLADDPVRQLLIVTHGTLAYLPFAALRDAQSGRYLVEQFALLHLPTASVLPALRSAARPNEPGRTPRSFAFAPFPEALPATRSEAIALRRTGSQADVFIGSRASEGALRRALASRGIVHVATHGVMNPRNPLFSHIDLAATEGSTNEDGRLEVHELFGLTVRSPLVFLSGCETGLGSSWSTAFDRGEDYATLAQAFLHAGARNVVAALWRIGDDGAGEFAAHFYRELRVLRSSEALAAAQRRLIADPRFRSPFFWASYRLSGDGSSVAM